MADTIRSVLPKRRRSMGGPRALRHDSRAAADRRSLLLRQRDLRLCRRPVVTFDASSRVWQALRPVASERTIAVEQQNRGTPRRERNSMDLGLQGKHAIVTGGSR